MPAESYYKQCTLTKGTKSEVVYIPEGLSVVGKFIKVWETEGWSDGWQVTKAAEHRVSGAYLRAHERDYLTQREASDV